MLVLQRWIAELGTGRRPLDRTRQVVSNVSKPTTWFTWHDGYTSNVWWLHVAWWLHFKFTLQMWVQLCFRQILKVCWAVSRSYAFPSLGVEATVLSISSVFTKTGSWWFALSANAARSHCCALSLDSYYETIVTS